MANLTISVPDDVLRRARSRAAQRGTSVSQLLRGSLRDFIDDEAEVGDAWDRFLGAAATCAGRSSEGRRTWRRSEVQRGSATTA